MFRGFICRRNTPPIFFRESNWVFKRNTHPPPLVNQADFKAKSTSTHPQKITLTFAPVRVFASMLSIYLLFLALLPCGDRQECTLFLENPAISTSSDHENHEHENEYCSPFCLCSCCGLSMNKECVEITYLNSIARLPSSIPQYEEKAPRDIYFSIWQPPKIS